MQFPTGAAVQQVRIARPTDQFDAVVRFSRDGLGLDVLRLWRHGHEAVPSENPWWDDGGFNFEDPDGWRVVVMHGPGLAV